MEASELSIAGAGDITPSHLSSGGDSQLAYGGLTTLHVHVCLAGVLELLFTRVDPSQPTRQFAISVKVQEDKSYIGEGAHDSNQDLCPELARNPVLKTQSMVSPWLAPHSQ